MEEIGNYALVIMRVIINLVTVGLVMASIPIMVRSVYTMVQAKSPRWDNLLFIPIVFLIFGLGLQLLPGLWIKSARIGISDARDEATLLQDELNSWLPENFPTDVPDTADDNGTTHTQLEITPEATAVPIVQSPTPEQVEEVVVVVTATPQPTPMPPTPTPAPPVCMGTSNQWLPGCVLPTPEGMTNGQ